MHRTQNYALLWLEFFFKVDCVIKFLSATQKRKNKTNISVIELVGLFFSCTEKHTKLCQSLLANQEKEKHIKSYRYCVINSKFWPKEARLTNFFWLQCKSLLLSSTSLRRELKIIFSKSVPHFHSFNCFSIFLW